MAGDGASKTSDSVEKEMKTRELNILEDFFISPDDMTLYDLDYKNRNALEALKTGTVKPVDKDFALMEPIEIVFKCICVATVSKKQGLVTSKPLEEIVSVDDMTKYENGELRKSELQYSKCMEFRMQAAGQVAGLNSLTVDEWEENIKNYQHDKEHPETSEAKLRKEKDVAAKKSCRAEYRITLTEHLKKENLANGSNKTDAQIKAEVDLKMDNLVATHNSDKVLGGNVDAVGSGRELTHMGGSSENGSFGGQGASKVQSMKQQFEERKGTPENKNKNPLMMNVKMKIICPHLVPETPNEKKQGKKKPKRIAENCTYTVPD